MARWQLYWCTIDTLAYKTRWPYTTHAVLVDCTQSIVKKTPKFGCQRPKAMWMRAARRLFDKTCLQAGCWRTTTTDLAQAKRYASEPTQPVVSERAERIRFDDELKDDDTWIWCDVRASRSGRTNESRASRVDTVRHTDICVDVQVCVCDYSIWIRVNVYKRYVYEFVLSSTNTRAQNVYSICICTSVSVYYRCKHAVRVGMWDDGPIRGHTITNHQLISRNDIPRDQRRHRRATHFAQYRGYVVFVSSQIFHIWYVHDIRFSLCDV